MILVNAGRFDEAIESCRRALAMNADLRNARQIMARALVLKGNTSEGIAILEQLGEGSRGQLGYAYAMAGRRAEAEALALQADTLGRDSALVFIYAGFRDQDRVFQSLEHMAQRSDPRLENYLGYPELAFIRDDPRWAAMRKKVGL